MFWKCAVDYNKRITQNDRIVKVCTCLLNVLIPQTVCPVETDCSLWK